jgi:hypothetical protein
MRLLLIYEKKEAKHFMADNQYVRIGTRVFENEADLENFLSNYGDESNGFVPYNGEKIVVKIKNETSGEIKNFYYVGDGVTPFESLIRSQGPHKASLSIKNPAAPDYIEGVNILD